ncbi:hypothetical protein BpHYR1_026477 [Brachionus plicatilis]|uniref:Uncharacterized protein n=1 Tax=Brachionus plicatilis TaxID=10195 RepID=A0A3M7QHE3_BRAPC|nr:hypothetical protein BpHYR1_026477 [Brachionus plicatilis]
MIQLFPNKDISSMDEISSYLSSEDDDSSLNSTKIAQQRIQEDNESDDFYDAIDNSSGSSIANDLTKKDCMEKRTEIELNNPKHEEKSNTEALKNDITTELDQKKIQTIKSSSSQIDWEDLDFLDEDPTSDDVGENIR